MSIAQSTNGDRIIADYSHSGISHLCQIKGDQIVSEFWPQSDILVIDEGFMSTLNILVDVDKDFVKNYTQLYQYICQIHDGGGPGAGISDLGPNCFISCRSDPSWPQMLTY